MNVINCFVHGCQHLETNLMPFIAQMRKKSSTQVLTVPDYSVIRRTKPSGVRGQLRTEDLGNAWHKEET